MTGFVLGLAVAVLVNLLTALFSREKALKLIPWLTFYVVVHGTLLALNTDTIRGAAMAFAGKSSSWHSYAIVMLLGAVSAGVYWRLINLGVNKLAHATSHATSDSRSPQPSSPTEPTEGPAGTPDTPLLRIEPEHDVLVSPSGAFTLLLTNHGADVDHIKAVLDYFTAQKDTSGSIRIKKIMNFEAATSPVVLRANQQLPLAVNFGGWVELAHRVASSSFQGLSLLGVRITLVYRRFSDQKEFTLVRAFGVSEKNQQGLWSLSGPSVSPVRSSQAAQSVTFSLDEVRPLLQSPEHWSGLSVHFENGTPVSAR